MRDSFTFALVSSADAPAAFAFHQSAAATNAHIWPRTESDIRQYAENNELFGVTRGGTGAFVALCYVTLDERTEEWELGGLIVDPNFRLLGLATVLLRLALAHTMAFNQPWANKQELIAHVHQENDNPRTLLDSLGFKHTQIVKIPGTDAPSSMKRDAEGNVTGDKFQFVPQGLHALAQWFAEESATALDGAAWVGTINLGPFTIEDLTVALRDLATRTPLE